MENDSTSETSELNDLVTKYSPFLKEIRKRILITLGAFALAMTVGFVFYERIIKFLIDLLSLKGINIVFTSPFQFINLAISCGVATGLLIVLPLIIYQILSFLKPALHRSEYKMVLRFLPFCIVLFFIGFSFGFMIMKWQIEISLAKSVSLGIGNILDISHLISTVLLTSALMGIGFQFPIVLFLLMRLGIMHHSQLSSHRMLVYIGSLIFAILLPPDSIVADILLSLPLIILFELTLLLDRLSNKKKVAVA